MSESVCICYACLVDANIIATPCNVSGTVRIYLVYVKLSYRPNIRMIE